MFRLSAIKDGSAQLQALGPEPEAYRVPINVTSQSPELATAGLELRPYAVPARRALTTEASKGSWQGLKFPDEADRRRLAALWGPAARDAGHHAPAADAFVHAGETVRVGIYDHWQLMEKACRAKFSQHAAARAAPLSTRNRPLVHVVKPDSRNIPSVVMAAIWMRIRDRLLRPPRRSPEPHEPAGASGRLTGMRQTPILIAACLSLLASATVAQADRDAARIDDFAKRMFATKSFDQKTYACFVRTYDAAHLARHPKQTVSAMKMLISAEKLEGDTSVRYSYRLGAKFRDRKGDYASAMACGHAYVSEVRREGVRVNCHDGCEGGGIETALAPDSKAIIVKPESISVWLADNPQDEKGQFEFKGGADDRVFRSTGSTATSASR